MRLSCWLLVVGCWLLVVGCWLLVVGCWLLVVGSAAHDNRLTGMPVMSERKDKDGAAKAFCNLIQLVYHKRRLHATQNVCGDLLKTSVFGQFP